MGPRDIYHYILQRAERDNTVTCVFWPVENRDETPGKVRMDMPLAGIKFKPLENDPRGKSEIHLFIKVNLGGAIPKWVMSQALSWSASGQLVYKKLIDGYLKKHPMSAYEKKPYVE